MEKVELVFQVCTVTNYKHFSIRFLQDLLQLQYEGLAVMKMFGRAKINVNLLIYPINKKFYGTQEVYICDNATKLALENTHCFQNVK